MAKKGFKQIYKSAQKEDNKFTQSINLINNGDIKNGLNILEDLYIKNKNNLLYADKLASIYVKLNRNTEAKQIYLELLNRKKFNSNLFINLGSIYISEEEIIKAIEISQKGIKNDPSSNPLKYNLSLSYFINKEYKKAERTINSISNYKDNIINLSILKCIIYSKIGNEERCFKTINSLANESFYGEFISNLIFRSVIFDNINLAVIVLSKHIEKEINRLYLISEIIQIIIKRNKFSLGIRFVEEYGVKNINDENILVNIGSIYMKLGDLDEAIKITQKALEINQESFEAHLNIGAMYKEKGLLEYALTHTQKALFLNNDEPTTQLNLASIYADMGVTSKALDIIEKYLSKFPNHSKAYLNSASIYQVVGDLDKAKEALKNCIKLNANEIRAFYLISIQKQSQDLSGIYKLILNMDEQLLKSKIDQIDLLFAKSNVQHQNKKYDEATDHLKKANKIKSSLFPSDYETYFKKSKRMMDIDERIIPESNVIKNQVDNIFIVGMPRCGSTLLESILCTNPSVIGLGEVFNVDKFYNRKKENAEISFPEFTNSIASNIYVDKQLYNFIYCGFIFNEIPNSKIIHLVRNPLDNLLSIFKTNFSSGNAYSTDIYECLKMYLLHLEVVNYYKLKYPQNLLTISYDNLVANPQIIIKNLVHWLNLEWNENYLQHHKFKRDVQTASKVQVRNKINNKSISGWKNYPKIFNEELFNSEIYKKIELNLKVIL